MTDLATVRQLDAADPLAAFRARFVLPDGQTYLDGNSLGALPRATAARLADTVTREWGQGLIGSWNAAGWIGAPQRIGAKIARLIGAAPTEVIAADSTSVNLFKLLAAACAAQPDRRVIVTEQGNFPTDLYVAQGVAAYLPGVEVRAVPRAQIAAAIDADVAVVMLTHVHYKTGAMYDMPAVTRMAQAQGALMLWDLSHSAGAVALDLAAANADLAVGCGYKYLNGGPGAPAFLFVAEHHQASLRSPLTGWMGHAAPFDFDDAYEAAPGMDRFLCGTPPILGMAALEIGIDLFLEADRTALFAKSRALCSLFVELVEERCAGLGLTLASPRDPQARGSHISLAHRDAYPVMQALIAHGVTGDFRAPDILRFGFTPLYVGYEDVWRAVEILRDVLTSKSWDSDTYRRRAAVT
ncbi:kynureninase [Sphingomonas hylomeconis]|uniref:Kynureninase n=1 Tax=Sphingomonas hylomeconis TaxID=1395958 RepID=A0ABV7SZ28_9SPHN|nr:kynureninase [Sphingomonas hylomeconis]